VSTEVMHELGMDSIEDSSLRNAGSNACAETLHLSSVHLRLLAPLRRRTPHSTVRRKFSFTTSVRRAKMAEENENSEVENLQLKLKAQQKEISKAANQKERKKAKRRERRPRKMNCEKMELGIKYK